MLSLVTVLVALLEIASVYSVCPDGWMAYSNTDLCIKAFYQQTTFVEAMDYCAALGNGGSLVSIHNAFQNVHVATAASEASSDCETWIGLYNFDGSSVYSWADGSALDYLDWAPDYPMPDIEGSMVFLDLNGKNKWVSTYSLAQTRCFVCQQNSIPPTVATSTTLSTKATTTTRKTTTKPTTTATPTCPAGWKYFNGHCYYIDANCRYYHDGESGCTRMGSSMVSIASEAENAFVLSMSTTNKCQNMWLGLVNYPDPAWRWLDGSPVTFTKWASGHPTNGFYAVQYANSYWYDTTSDYAFACVLCKKAATWA